MQVVIFGATGMVGYEVLLRAIERDEYNGLKKSDSKKSGFVSQMI